MRKKNDTIKLSTEDMADLINKRNELIKESNELSNVVKKIRIMKEISKLDDKILGTDLNVYESLENKF